MYRKNSNYYKAIKEIRASLAKKKKAKTYQRRSKGYLRSSGLTKFYGKNNVELKWHDTMLVNSGTDVGSWTTGMVPMNTGVSFPGVTFFGAKLLAADTLTGTSYSDLGLCAVPQGTEPWERIGRKITVTKLSIRFQIGLAPWLQSNTTMDGQVAASLVRIIIGIDKQTNGTALTVTDLFEANMGASNNIVIQDHAASGNHGATAGHDISYYQNLANSERFLILADKTIKISPQTSMINTSTGSIGNGVQFHDIKTLKYNKRLNLPIEYKSTAGALTEITSNSIFVCVMPSYPKSFSSRTNGEAFAVNDNVLISMHSRIRFTDQ